jgi:hypothetical protein
VEDQKIRYDLKKPCADCPFRKDAKYHGGVMSDLPKYIEKGNAKELVHTCHKTDPRSDSPEGQKYTGEVQHCAGLLLMMHQNQRLIGPHQLSAWLTKKWDRDSMDTSIKVFKNLKEMGKRYVALAKKELKRRDKQHYHTNHTTSDGMVIRISHGSPEDRWVKDTLQSIER